MRSFLRIYFSHSLIMLLNHLESLEKNHIFLCMILTISVLFFLLIRSSADKRRCILYEISESV